MLFVGCRYSSDIMRNRGYSSATRVIIDGEQSYIEDECLGVKNVRSLMLLTKIKYMEEYSGESARSIKEELYKIVEDYDILLKRNREIMSEFMGRSSLEISSGDE